MTTVRSSLDGALRLVTILLLVAAGVFLFISSAPKAPIPSTAIGGSQPTNGPSSPTAPGAAAEVSVRAAFGNYCIRASDVMLRSLTKDELASLDARAAAKAPGWLVDGGPWTEGQSWAGDFDGAMAAYGGTRLDEPGNWLITEKDGRPLAMSLRKIDLPSGRALWTPHNFMIAVDCPN
jgi:hypothetical protein